MKTAQIEALADAIDSILGIAPRKTAIMNPDLLQLLRVAHLRHRLARHHSSLAAKRETSVRRRLALPSADAD